MPENAFPIDAGWLELLACPVCRGALEARRDPDRLRCAACGRDWPVVDGIPDLVPPDEEPPAA